MKIQRPPFNKEYSPSPVSGKRSSFKRGPRFYKKQIPLFYFYSGQTHFLLESLPLMGFLSFATYSSLSLVRSYRAPCLLFKRTWLQSVFIVLTLPISPCRPAILASFLQLSAAIGRSRKVTLRPSLSG